MTNLKNGIAHACSAILTAAFSQNPSISIFSQRRQPASQGGQEGRRREEEDSCACACLLHSDRTRSHLQGAGPRLTDLLFLLTFGDLFPFSLLSLSHLFGMHSGGEEEGRGAT